MTATPLNIDINIGQRLRLRRVELGWSQKDLAGLVALSWQQVSKYEKGDHRAHASKLYEMSIVLGVQITYFFEDVELPVEGSGREALEFMKIYLKIGNQISRQRLREMAKSLMDKE